ncbi:MAG: hypothetical protein ACREOH_21360 [Candidatus Entotheonellia bacterium]
MAPGDAPWPTSVLQEVADAALVQVLGAELVALEPPTQAGDQPQFLLGGGVGVPMFGEPPGKPAAMGAQGADMPRVMRGKRVGTCGSCHGDLLLP